VTSRVLSNPQVLSPLYVPEKISFRESEISQLQSAIINQVHTFLHGDVGIGKSTLVKHVIPEFKGRSIYIDCGLYQTTNAILREILSALSSLVMSRSNYDLLKRIREKTKNGKFLVCVDHFEHLKEVGVVSKLVGLGIIVILVADKEESYLRLDLQTRSSFTNMLKIAPYSSEQSLAILSERARLSLKEWTYSDSLLKKIAVQCKGNISLGLNLLRTAALKAESENRAKIEESDIPEIDCPESELNQDEKTLLQILQEQKSLPSSRLFVLYCEKTRYPKGERSYRNYMKDLCVKGLAKSFGDKTGRIYEIAQEDADGQGNDAIAEKAK